MSKSLEIEARFLNLKQKDIEEKLIKLGAQKIGEYFFKEWIFHYPEWDTHGRRRIRLRTDGKKHTLTYKANPTWEVDSTEEIEFDVSSADEAMQFMKATDIPLQRYQEKKRIRYKLRDMTFELDFWPKIPMVLEIEAPSKEVVKEGAGLLGLDWKDAVFVDQKMVHEQYYHIDLDKYRDYRFDS